jgi:hypothetical protein
MNVELLEKIKAHILANPHSIDMRNWSGECGTVACIAGHACLFAGHKPIKAEGFDYEYFRINGKDAEEVAMELLRLSRGDAYSLFHLSHWPDKFFEAYTQAFFTETQAKVTAERIDFFIKYQR